jgi:hypothetical protein
LKAALFLLVFALHSALAELPAAFRHETRTNSLFNVFETENQQELKETEDKFLENIKSMKHSLEEGSLQRLLVSFAERYSQGETLESLISNGPIDEADSLFLKAFLQSIPLQFINGDIYGRVEKQSGTSIFFRAASSLITVNVSSAIVAGPPTTEERRYIVGLSFKKSDWFEHAEWRPKKGSVSLGKLVVNISYPLAERDRLVLGMRHSITNDFALVPFKRGRVPSRIPRDEFPLLATVQTIAERERIPALQKLAERGDLEAIHLLGSFFETGVGTNADPRRAFEFYQRAAREGYQPSLVKVGTAHWQGTGTVRSEELAKKAFEEASSLGSVAGLSKLGSLLSKTESTRALGEEYLAAAAERGDVEALMRLAEIASAAGKRPEEILDLLDLPIVSQHAPAAYMAARLLSSAQNGTPDRPEALRLLMLACAWLKPGLNGELPSEVGALIVKLRSEMVASEKVAAFAKLAAGNSELAQPGTRRSK